MRKIPAASPVVWLALCTLLAAGCGGTENSDPTLNTGGDNLGADTTDPSEPDAAAGGTGKITLCHIPPGNPANAHTVTVGLPAMSAHLRHGDTLGACGNDGGTPSDGGTCESDGGSADAGTGGDVDAGPVCSPEGADCSVEGPDSCCTGLSCLEGRCWTDIG
ncbi:hypothetical protein [Corallococcus sp. CA047B]|uniref:hypothetical protein n=1 Tax=Corallococcus sp. CA047B TaxID=2316729 RepID=UPI0011C47306|nr:hypothetical protein [Corallococcus sp. CA047B]